LRQAGGRGGRLAAVARVHHLLRIELPGLGQALGEYGSGRQQGGTQQGKRKSDYWHGDIEG
jgi:hypothetical protein